MMMIINHGTNLAAKFDGGDDDEQEIMMTLT